MKTVKTTETMKTKAMKTKTNFGKAAMCSVALVVSLILAVSAVEAKDLQKKNAVKSRRSEMAFFDMSKKEFTSVDANADNSIRQFTDKAFDPASELEIWMLNSNYFETTDFQTKSTSEVPVENHMPVSNLFNELRAVEEPLEVEEWMISSRFWIF